MPVAPARVAGARRAREGHGGRNSSFGRGSCPQPVDGPPAPASGGAKGHRGCASPSLVAGGDPLMSLTPPSAPVSSAPFPGGRARPTASPSDPSPARPFVPSAPFPASSPARFPCTAAAATSRAEWRIRARIDHVTFDEEIGELRGRFGEFRNADELVRHAGKRVQLGRNIRLAQQLQKIRAALGRHRDVGESVEENRRREALDVGTRRRHSPGLLAAPFWHRERTTEAFPCAAGHGVVGEACGHVGRHPGIASLAFEFGVIGGRRGEQREVAASGIARHRDSRRIDAEPRRIRARPSD